MSTRMSQSQDKRSLQTRVLTLIAARPGRMRDSLQTLLETLPGMVTDRADDGATALRMVVEQQPLVVLLDANLPGQQGWDVLEQIKVQRPQTHCLLLADSSQQHQAAQAAGADGVLLKGFSTVELFATIEEMLARGERRGATTALGAKQKGRGGAI